MPADKFALEKGSDHLLANPWAALGTAAPNLTYHSCQTCDVRTHADGVELSGAVQVATLEDADPDTLAAHIAYVDGRHGAFDRPPADTRLL